MWSLEHGPEVPCVDCQWFLTQNQVKLTNPVFGQLSTDDSGIVFSVGNWSCGLSPDLDPSVHIHWGVLVIGFLNLNDRDLSEDLNRKQDPDPLCWHTLRRVGDRGDKLRLPPAVTFGDFGHFPSCLARDAHTWARDRGLISGESESVHYTILHTYMQCNILHMHMHYIALHMLVMHMCVTRPYMGHGIGGLEENTFLLRRLHLRPKRMLLLD